MQRFDALRVVETSRDAPDPIGLAVELVIAGFMQDVRQDKHTAGETDTEPEEIDKGNKLVFPQIAEGNLEIIL